MSHLLRTKKTAMDRRSPTRGHHFSPPAFHVVQAYCNNLRFTTNFKRQSYGVIERVSNMEGGVISHLFVGSGGPFDPSTPVLVLAVVLDERCTIAGRNNFARSLGTYCIVPYCTTLDSLLYRI